jgi:hypothetical protein
MQIIDTTGKFIHTATKTEPIKAVKIAHHVWGELIHLMTLNTREGSAVLGADNYICLGIVGEPWQQTPEKINSAYTPGGVDADGWEIWIPRPNNLIEMFYSTQDGYVQGAWGSTIPGVGERLQMVKAGDAIARDPHNHLDQWRVARSMFDATYTVTK